jgi:hypothetical protein
METDELKLPVAFQRTALRLHLLFTRCYSNVCRADALAVIFQSAFVPVVYGWLYRCVEPELSSVVNLVYLPMYFCTDI